jgi:hypothetical protein
MGIVLAMALAAPVVGVQTDGIAPCDTNAFDRDLRTLRPELEILPLHGAPAEARLSAPGTWLASIEGVSSNQPVLRVTGNPTPLLRSLPAQDCRRVVEIAASIVDGLLDQLPNPARDIGSFEVAATTRISLSAWVGAGTLQGPIAWMASLALGARLGLGAFEIVGSADVGFPPASLPLATLDQGSVGSYQATPVDLEAGGGWSPRLGPGRVSLDGFVGAALAIVSTRAGSEALFSTQPQLIAELFLAAAAGYALDLSDRFSVGLRVEERWAPVQANATVNGESPAEADQVVTRRWSFGATLTAGWRFF